ncbi:MAG: hypothetical protein Fur0039_24110 [Rhodocyclaceae bacterium]
MSRSHSESAVSQAPAKQTTSSQWKTRVGESHTRIAIESPRNRKKGIAPAGGAHAARGRTMRTIVAEA